MSIMHNATPVLKLPSENATLTTTIPNIVRPAVNNILYMSNITSKINFFLSKIEIQRENLAKKVSQIYFKILLWKFFF